MGKLRKKGWRVREGRRKEGEEDKRKREERKERMRSEAGQSYHLFQYITEESHTFLEKSLEEQRIRKTLENSQPHNLSSHPETSPMSY